MPTPEEITVALEECLRLETVLYRQVRELSRGQLNLIAQGNTPGLLQTISNKQDCLGRIEAIERQAAPYKAMREREMERWPTALRGRIAPLVRELQTLLGEIVALEEQGRMAAEKQAALARERMQVQQTGKAMLNAYSKVRKTSPSAIQDRNA